MWAKFAQPSYFEDKKIKFQNGEDAAIQWRYGLVIECISGPQRSMFPPVVLTWSINP